MVLNATVRTMTPKSLYAAFDTFPAPKGAAIHIQHMAKVLFEFKPPGALYVLGGDELPAYQREGHVEIFRYSAKIANLLERTLDYGGELSHWLNSHGNHLELCHFRDPWSAFPIIEHKHRNSHSYKTLYEVNGLPSIELPYAYPHVAESTLAKVEEQENFCLKHSNHLITPSETTKEYLIEKGIAESKITLIRNGAELVGTTDRPAMAPSRYLLYFGALQQWQGIDDLLRAFSQLTDITDLELVICASKHNRVAKQYRKMADKLDIQNRIHWFYGLQSAELLPWISHAYLSVAPLLDCSRNTVQGCCPLKIIESMAAGTPVIASNLPVTKELITDNVNGRLHRPGRPADLARIIRALIENPRETKRLGENAKQQAEDNWSWKTAERRLENVYDQLTSLDSDTSYQHSNLIPI